MKSGKISVGGMLTALSLLLLYISSAAPSAKLALLAAASYCIGLCAVYAGVKYAACAYAAVSLLGFLIVPNKAYAVTFFVFFGNYPIIKLYIEKLDKLWLEWIIKIVAFNIYAAVVWAVCVKFMLFTTNAASALPILVVILNAAFVIYDFVFNFTVTKILMQKGRKL